MKRVLTALLLCACSTSMTSGGYPIVHGDVAGHTWSCKGAQCCYPWNDHGTQVFACIKPIEGGEFGVTGAVIVLRGRMP